MPNPRLSIPTDSILRLGFIEIPRREGKSWTLHHFKELYLNKEPSHMSKDDHKSLMQVSDKDRDILRTWPISIGIDHAAPLTANARQVGGVHYKTSFEHWDLVEETGMGYLEAQLTRYITRWRKKDGLQGLEKALHYGTKLLEEITQHKRRNKAMDGKREEWKMERTAIFCEENGMTDTEALIMNGCLTWRKSTDVVRVNSLISALINGAKSNPGSILIHKSNQ